MHVQNKKYRNFVFISHLTDKCPTQKLFKIVHHMVILRSQNKRQDFFMILAWCVPLNYGFKYLDDPKDCNHWSLVNLPTMQRKGPRSNLTECHSTAIVGWTSSVRNQMGFFNLKSSFMSWSALSDSFEYLCYGSTAIRNIFTLTVRGSTLVVRIWRLQTSDSDD